MTEVLPEIAEQDAAGETARIYDDIRSRMGVPMVALFYRNLAAIDGALEWMWAVIRPMVDDGRLESAAASVASQGHCARIGPLSVADPATARAASDIVAAYNRANPFNLTCAMVLGQCLSSSRSTPPDAAIPAGHLPPAVATLPAMVALDAIPTEVMTRLAALETPDTRGDGIVASLYRHLAHWPDLLAAAAEALAPRFGDGGVQTAARAVAARASELAPHLLADTGIPALPDALEANRAVVSRSVERFSRRIPEMIVAGRLLAAAMGENGE